MSWFTNLAFPVTMMVVASGLAGQFTAIPNTGCAGAASVLPFGAPKLGQQIGFAWSCPASPDLPAMILAPSLPVFFLPAPLGCGIGCGLIDPNPHVVVVGTPAQLLSVQLPVPTSVDLVGAVLAAQGACLAPASCIQLSVGIAAVIQR